MAEERAEAVYDIDTGFGYSNPYRYLQQVFRGFLRCLGFENNQGEEGKQRGGGSGSTSDSGQEGGNGGGEGGEGGGGGRELDDPLEADPPDEPAASVTSVVRRRPPSRGPISSGGPGQTN